MRRRSGRARKTRKHHGSRNETAMTAWWDIGSEARATIRRPTEEEFRLETKDFFIQMTVLWGEIAGINDACYICHHRRLLWQRYDPKFRSFMEDINRDVDRRTAEGDRSALLGRLRVTRAPAKSSDRDPEKPTYLIHPGAPPDTLTAALKALAEIEERERAAKAATT